MDRTTFRERHEFGKRQEKTCNKVPLAAAEYSHGTLYQLSYFGAINILLHFYLVATYAFN